MSKLSSIFGNKLRLTNKYIPEIDGLRALAVSLVILFHVGYEWLPGGYIGVDVFFVISGYLITKQMLRQMDEGRFAFAQFYIRRVRRLLPAMLVTVFATMVMGFLLFSIFDFRRLGAMSLSSLLGVANLYFFGEADYFSDKTAVDPLLHFWSLAVEEQFYLVAPILTFLVFSKFSFQGVLKVSLGIFFLSFFGAFILYDDFARMVFFLPVFRAWEFIFGGLLLWISRPSDSISSICTLVGTVLILIGSVLITDAYGGWPVSNLLPCIGAALILVSLNNTAQKFIFGNPVSVFVGRISYSLYLVHWPIIVCFLYAQQVDQLSSLNRLWAISLSLAAATLLYNLVEKRFRFSISTEATGSSKSFLRAAFACMAVLLVISGLMAISSGWKWRVMTDVIQDGEGYGHCRDEHVCSLGNYDENSDSLDLVVTGDSHAKHLSAGLEKWTRESGGEFLLVSSAACVPIVGAPFYKHNQKKCISIRRRLPTILEKNPKAAVVVAQRWRGIEDRENVLNLYLKMLESRPAGSVLIIGQTPELPEWKRKCGTMHSFLLPKDVCSPIPEDKDAKRINQQLEKFAKQHNFRFANPELLLCENEECKVEMDGRPIFVDVHHISKFASELFVKSYLEQLPVGARK